MEEESEPDGVPRDPSEAAAEAKAILRDWPSGNPWSCDAPDGDGDFDDLIVDVADRSARLGALALEHDSVNLVIVEEIRTLLGGAGEYRLTQDLNEDGHVKLCLLLYTVVWLDELSLDELSSTVPRPDEYNRLMQDSSFYEGPVRLWYPSDKDFYGQLLAAIDPRPSGKKKKKKKGG